MRNIVIIGMSGSGKTTLGRLLAAELGYDFIDTDLWIEQHSKLRVKQIFAGYGEPFFRAIESEAVWRAARQPATVIATGGGVILNEENIRVLRQTGVLVFLDRPAEQIAHDIQLGHRPLLSAGVGRVFAMAAERRPRYLEYADLVLPNEGTMEEALEAFRVMARMATARSFAVAGGAAGRAALSRIHCAALTALEEPAECTAVDVPRHRLREMIAAARVSYVRGFAVTAPLQRDILPMLDEIDEDARLCGTVGTVAVRDGRLCGCNTDFKGLALAMVEAGVDFLGKRVVILGTGGIAAGIALGAARLGATHIELLGRPEKTRALAGRVKAASPVTVEVGELVPIEIAKAASGADILINATPPGVHGISEEFLSLHFLEALPSHAMVCDLACAPTQTRLIEKAQALKLRTLEGQTVLIWQALLADEFLLGHTIDKVALCRRIADTLSAQGEAAV